MHQLNIHTLQVMVVEYRDAMQTETFISRAEKIPYIYFVTVYRAKNPFKLGESSVLKGRVGSGHSMFPPSDL